MPGHEDFADDDADVLIEMVNGPGDSSDAASEPSADKAAVRAELERMRAFVSGLTMEDIKRGTWFAKLLTYSLGNYVARVNADYFRTKYPHLPTDAIVESRIRLASRYAGIEGALNSAAASGAVVATIGTGGGASPLTLPAAATSFTLDLVYTTQIQLKLAYDIAVLYGVPLDLDDPEDLWRLIRIALVVKSGEVGTNAATKAVPAFLRPAVKKVFSGATLQAAKELPVVGKYLLQRNIVKFSIPGVSIPLSAGMNTWMTRVAGAHARHVFREEARIVEAAQRLATRARNHEALLWSMWLVLQTDKHVSEQGSLLLHHVSRLVEHSIPPETLAALRTVVEVDSDMVLSLLSPDMVDAATIHEGAVLAAAVKGKVRDDELAWVEKIADACGVEHDAGRVRRAAKSWR